MTNNYLENYLSLAIASDYNYLLIMLIIAGSSALLAIMPIIAGYYLGWKKPPAWSVVGLAVIACLLFIGSFVIALKTPSVYQGYYDTFYKSKYIGTPDDTTGSCPIYAKDGNAYKMVPLLNKKGEPVYSRNVNPFYTNTILQPVMVKVKVVYNLYAKPFGPEKGYPRIYLLLGNKQYKEPHLCAIEMNSKFNYEFMKQAQGEWDKAFLKSKGNVAIEITLPDPQSGSGSLTQEKSLAEKNHLKGMKKGSAKSVKNGNGKNGSNGDNEKESNGRIPGGVSPGHGLPNKK